jgi:hypothetical protein
LKAKKQNVASLELTIGEQNVVPLKPGVDESSSPCGLKLVMVVVCNSSDETPPNTNWEFQSKSGGLNCFKIYIHLIKCKTKNYTKRFKFNCTCTFHHLMEGAGFFSKVFYCDI